MERKHYAVIRALAESRLDAVQYLYGRLSIIDAKSASLLQVNGFLLAVMTFMTTAIFVYSETSHRIENLAKLAGAPAAGWMVWIFLAALLLLAVSTALCFLIFHLIFDHVSNWSKGLEAHFDGSDAIARLDGLKKLLESECPDPIAGRCSGGGKSVGVGSIEQYEEMFLRITLRRQAYLRCASLLSRGAGILLAAAYLDYLGALALR